MAERTVPITEARPRLTEIIGMIEREPVTLTKDGRPVAVILFPDDYESMVATLELLRDPSARQQIDAIISQEREGTLEYVSHVDAKRLLREARSRG